MVETRVLRLEDEGEWNAFLERIEAKDLCHFPRFSRIYEETGDGVAECFVYEKEGEVVVYPYIRRPLNSLPFAGGRYSGYYDVVTPYCYGGFVHNAGNEAEARRLIDGFRRAFEDHARKTKIVSEFIRFHPLLQNQRFCNGFFDRLFLHQDNVIVELEQDEADILKRCRPSYRQCITKAATAGLSFERATLEGAAGFFADMYSETMARHNQTGYLNFPRNYFEALFANLGGDLILFKVCLEGKVAAAALFLRFDDRMDYFLAASDKKLLHLHPTHFLLFETFRWARKEGCRQLQLGGGRDSLVFFKRGFSKLTKPYHVAHHVHDADAYDELAQARNDYPDARPGYCADFFPAYRKGIE